MLIIFKALRLMTALILFVALSSQVEASATSSDHPSLDEQQKLGLQLAHTILRGVQWIHTDEKTPGCLVPDELPNVSPRLERNDEQITDANKYKKRFLLVDNFRVRPVKDVKGSNPFRYNFEEDTFWFRFSVEAQKSGKKGYVRCKAGGSCKLAKNRQVFAIKVGLGTPTPAQLERIQKSQRRPRSWAVSGLSAIMLNSDVVESLRVLPKKCAQKR